MSRSKCVSITLGAITAIFAVFAPVAGAHQDYSLAPSGASPFVDTQGYHIPGSWYGEKFHKDTTAYGHPNDYYALDLVPRGGDWRIFSIYNSFRVDYVDRNNGTLITSGSAGGRQHQVSYLHMSSIDVNPGQWVGQSTRLGVMGNRGNSYGAHLHLSVRVLGGDGLWYSRRIQLCGREPHHDHSHTFKGC